MKWGNYDTYASPQPCIVSKSLSDCEAEDPKHYPVVVGIVYHRTPALHGCPPPQRSLNKFALLVRNNLFHKRHTKIELFPHIDDVTLPFPMVLSGFEKLQSIGLISIQ